MTIMLEGSIYVPKISMIGCSVGLPGTTSTDVMNNLIKIHLADQIRTCCVQIV